MTVQFTLAHISDPHLAPLPTPPLSALIGKRLMGYLSWRSKRRKVHRAEVLSALTRDLKSQNPEHVVITGDLTNISLPAEFSAAARWLAELGPAEDVTVIPGNHDAYVALDWSRTWQKWADYMADDGEDGTKPPADFEDFPFLRVRGPVALIGASSAQPSPPGFASGRLGIAQLRRIAALLETARERGLCRVLLVHHPPVGPIAWRKRLVDAEALCDVIRRHGAEIVLHGHDHSFSEQTIEGFAAPVPVFGIPSASAAEAHGRRPHAHYGILRIEPTEGGWTLELRHRGFDSGSGGFTETTSLTRHLPASVGQN
jgi:3',5'-cyclic AMP phosphodiesterase CpdA